MGRRIIFSIWLTMLIAAAVAYSQQARLSSLNVSGQELYVEQLQSVNAFTTSVNKGAVSLKANLLGVLSSEGEVKIYAFPKLEEKIMLAALSSRVNALSFSASGQTLALGAADGKAYLFNSATGTNSKSISIHSKGIATLIFQEENWIFSVGADNKVIVTDVISGDALGSLPSFSEDVTALTVQPGAKCLAVGLSNGAIQIFSVDNFVIQKTFTDSKEKISRLCYSPDGLLLSAGTVDGSIYIWDTQTGLLKIKYNCNFIHFLNS